MGRVVVAPDGGSLHVGGRVRPAKPHRLMLHAPKYGLNLSAWPATPSQTSYGQNPAAQACLTDVLGNDKLGCCTEANSYHLQALRQAAAGRPVFHPLVGHVIATYSRDGNYDPNDPSTDQGCDENVVLANAQQLGITNGDGVDCIAGYVGVDASNRDLVRACCTMFVGGAICAELPDSWLNSAAPGSTWDFPKDGFNPSNGHCFTLGDQGDATLAIWSWGRPLILTYDGLAACASGANGGAIYFLVDAEILAAASDAAPDALDWSAVQADFKSLQGPDPIVPPGP